MYISFNVLTFLLAQITALLEKSTKGFFEVYKKPHFFLTFFPFFIQFAPGITDRQPQLAGGARPRLIESADFNNEDDQLSKLVPRSFPSTDAQRPSLANNPGSRPSPAKPKPKSQFVISGRFDEHNNRTVFLGDKIK